MLKVQRLQLNLRQKKIFEFRDILMFAVAFIMGVIANSLKKSNGMSNNLFVDIGLSL